MKKENPSSKKQIFRFKFNSTTLILIILGLLLCAAGIATSIWRLVNTPPQGLTECLQSPLLIGVCVFGLVVLISMLVRSQYEVDENFVTVRFGIIKSATPVKDVTAIELDKDSDKLSLYTGETFSVILVNKEWNDEFVTAVQAVNPKVEYSIVMAKNKPKKEE